MPKTYEDIRDCSAEQLQQWLDDEILPVNEHIMSNRYRENRLTLLHITAKEGQLKKTLLLLQHGAEVNRPDGDDYTPLHHLIHEISFRTSVVCHKGRIIHAMWEYAPYPAIIEALLESGAHVNTRDPYEDDTPLHEILSAQRLDHAIKMAIVNILLQYGADIHATNARQQTPLHVATFVSSDAMQDDAPIVKALLDLGANPDVQDNRGNTALHNIVLRGHKNLKRQEKVVQMLLNKGASPNRADHKNRVPLLYAVMRDSTAIARLLLERGANVNHVNGMGGMTPLHAAIYKGSKAMIQMLLDWGADPMIPNDKGETAIDKARNQQDKTMLHMLYDAQTVIASGIAGGALIGMKQQLQQQHPSSLNRSGKGLASLPDEVLMNVGGWVAKLGDRNDLGSLARVSKSALEGAKGERQKVLGKWTAKLEEERVQQGGEKGQGK